MPDSARSRTDTTHRDSLAARRDSTRRDTAVVHWPASDSITNALLVLPGYDKTQLVRYQSDTALFDLSGHDLTLLPDSGKKADVQRGTMLVVCDSSVDYRQRDSTVSCNGDYIVHDPSTGQADVHGSVLWYDLARKSALLSHAHFKYNTSGADWFMTGDVVNMSPGPTFYSGPGTLTSCDDSVPDYHFAFGEAKRTSDKTMLMRPVEFYISDIPVMWFPFMFETNQGGRQSGVLTPQFGINDIVRTSSAYHRSVNNIGYYWAADDYNDVEAWFDWRSSLGANSDDGDPGYVDYNAVWNYAWLNEFLIGNAGVSYTQEGDGSTNLHLALNHTEKFAHNGNLNASINYVTNTTIQRQNSFDPTAALATIQSQVSYSEQLGPATISLGGTRTQHPGREEVDESYPSLQITTPEIAVANWLSWTPTFSFSTSQSLHLDQPGTFTYRYFDSSGVRDSSLLNRSQYTAALSFNTPVKFFGQDIGNSFTVNSTENNYPEEFTLYDVVTGDSTGTRVYAKTFEETVDWVPQYALPPIGRNLFNISPTVSLGDVDPGPFWIKTERTNGEFVHQSKRLTFGLSASPTIFGLFPGLGPFLGFRHSIAPTLSYGYAPAASVPDDYLAATGRSQAGYLGALAENVVSLGLNQTLEAKILSPGDTDQSKAQKIKLLTVAFTPLAYDFTRLTAPEITNTHWWRALTTQNWGYSVNSDLLPGFAFATDYSLFQGSTTSDTAVFKPVLDNVSASLNMTHDQNPLTVLAKLFGKKAPPKPVRDTSRDSTSDSTRAQALALPTAENGVLQSTRANTLNKTISPLSQGWHLNLSYTSSIPRPPEGGRIIDIDPTLRCQQIAGTNPFLLAACITQLQTAPTAIQPIVSTTVGGPSYLVSPTTNIAADVGFDLTPKWAVTWHTNYDLVHHQFASHVVTLSRDLHDWRALFGFTQSPNGNFAFTFTIALKADPDLKFDYDRASVRSGEPF